MRRGQISIDFLFAVTLVMLTVLNLVYIATNETTQAENFDTLSKLKVFSIDIRDSVTKVYSVGSGFKIKKELPLKLEPGEWVTVKLDNTTNRVVITAYIGGKNYYTAQKLPVPVGENSEVILTGNHTTFWIKAEYNEGGSMLDVTLSP